MIINENEWKSNFGGHLWLRFWISTMKTGDSCGKEVLRENSSIKRKNTYSWQTYLLPISLQFFKMQIYFKQILSL